VARGGYILGPMIARGGMAEVYLAKAFGRHDFERVFAIKRILPHYAQDPDFVAMFRDEANIVRRMHHGNIVQVLDFDEIGGSVAMIMEFVEGVDLRALLAANEKSGKRFSIPHSLYIGREVARALAYAHTRLDDATNEPLNLVHRDISPQNILISYQGEIKIIDFGVARVATAKLNETKPGTVKGKYSYMSPEQVGARELDGRSDVFSLGIVLWEVLAMRRLFNGDSEVDTIRRVQECRIPESLSKLNREVTEELEKIICKALAKDPDHRYASAAEFEQSLSSYLNANYPNFVAREVGEFAAKLTASRRSELQRHVKKAWSLTPSMAQKLNASSQPESLNQAPRMTGTGSVSFTAGPAPVSGSQPSSQFNSQTQNKLRDSSNGSYRNQPSSRISYSQTSNPPLRTELRSAFAKSRTAAFQELIRNRVKSTLNPTTLVLVALTAFVIIGVGYMLMNLPQKPDNPLVKFELSTSPPRVRIQVDGESRFDGRYIQTPLTIKIPPGKRRLSVLRDGYRTVTFTIDGDPGQLLRSRPVRLNQDSKIDFAQAKIISKKTGKLRYGLSDGYFNGTIPTGILDLPANMDHRIVVTDERNIETRCMVRSKNLSKSKLLVINFDNSVTPGKCSLSLE
jgi:serine/threonine protein kinase